nr:MAG TPA: hypothetical protein [Caudoviricetes sp.]
MQILFIINSKKELKSSLEHYLHRRIRLLLSSRVGGK